MQTANAAEGRVRAVGCCARGARKDPLILRTDIARQGYSQKHVRSDTEECPSDTGDYGVVDRPWTPPQPNTPMRAVLKSTCEFT
jgi:hypothetical protein